MHGLKREGIFLLPGGINGIAPHNEAESVDWRLRRATLGGAPSMGAVAELSLSACLRTARCDTRRTWHRHAGKSGEKTLRFDSNKKRFTLLGAIRWD